MVGSFLDFLPALIARRCFPSHLFCWCALQELPEVYRELSLKNIRVSLLSHFVSISPSSWAVYLRSYNLHFSASLHFNFSLVHFTVFPIYLPMCRPLLFFLNHPISDTLLFCTCLRTGCRNQIVPSCVCYCNFQVKRTYSCDSDLVRSSMREYSFVLDTMVSLVTIWQCFLKVNLPSILTPKYFTSVFHGIWRPSIVIFRSGRYLCPIWMSASLFYTLTATVKFKNRSVSLLACCYSLFIISSRLRLW